VEIRATIPVYGKGVLEYEVFKHFGHVFCFILLKNKNRELAEWKYRKNVYSESHIPRQVLGAARKSGADIVACGGISYKAKRSLAKCEIEVVEGLSGSVKEVLGVLCEKGRDLV